MWRHAPPQRSQAHDRPGRPSRFREPVTFGAADGVTLLIGLLVALHGQPHALVKAAVGAGLAEWVGMSAGAWLSDERAGIGPALANGTAALGACAIPAVPYLAGGGPVALTAALVLACSVAGVVSLLRPERGVLAFATTFGILAAAAVLCWAASLA